MIPLEFSYFFISVMIAGIIFGISSIAFSKLGLDISFIISLILFIASLVLLMQIIGEQILMYIISIIVVCCFLYGLLLLRGDINEPERAL